jgi:hypothetical protein
MQRHRKTATQPTQRLKIDTSSRSPFLNHSNLKNLIKIKVQTKKQTLTGFETLLELRISAE